MNEKLLKRKEMRETTVGNNRKDRDLNKIDSEDSDYIMKQINDMKLIIESNLEKIGEIHNKNQIEESLEELNTEYERLNKLINDSSLFLAKYNLKSVQTLLNLIRNKIDAKKDSLIPKSKFSFKSSFKAHPKSEIKAEDCDQTDSMNERIDSNIFFGFKNISDKSLRMSSEEANGKDIQLDSLQNCQIEIFGAPNALKMNGLFNCQVFCGPTTTSIFIANCRKCLFRIASQQLRIHSSFETDFYIHVTSRAIIEDSKTIRFGRYDWVYPTIKEDFVSANLDINSNNWKQIDDFDCLTDEPSNNWSFID